MANFTQLHLNNASPKEPSKNTRGDGTKFYLSKEKTLFGAGLLAITAMSGVFLLITNGCSKGSSKPVSIEQPAVQTPANPAPTTPAIATAQPAVVVPQPAKKRVQRKAPLATYSDAAHGISFRYPKGYILKNGDSSELTSVAQPNFVEPGAMKVVAIELPRTSYPGTDFTSGFFNVNMNSALSAEQCEQFAFPKSEHPEIQAATISKVKIAGIDYAMVEDSGDSGRNRMKYFHRFDNGNCYEFSMGMTTVDDNLAGLKPVNRSLVFGRLEQILSSVKVQPIVVPEVAKQDTEHPMVDGSKQ